MDMLFLYCAFFNMWGSNCNFWQNPLSHTEHTYGLAGEWMGRCPFKSLFIKSLYHKMFIHKVSLPCVKSYGFSSDFASKIFCHPYYTYTVSAQYVSKCALSNLEHDKIGVRNIYEAFLLCE